MQMQESEPASTKTPFWKDIWNVKTLSSFIYDNWETTSIEKAVGSPLLISFLELGNVLVSGTAWNEKLLSA
jgi:hypothetical protein